MYNNKNKQYLKYKKKYKQLKQPIKLTIKQPWFDLIKSGKKTIEGRLKRGIFIKLKPNDIIIWEHKKLNLKVTVKYINNYNSFEEMLKKEGMEKVLPNINSIEAGVNKYHEYFSLEDEKQYGVISIGMQLIQEQDFKIHVMKLDKQYYDSIKNGIKLFEVRVNDEKRQQLKVNDIIIFQYNKNLLQTELTEIKIYKSFEEAINDTNLDQLLPNIKTKTEAIEVYENFDNGNYKINAQKYGVIKLRLNLCNKINKSNTNYLPILDPWLTQIKLGNKTVEGRKGDVNKYQKWVGKYAVFHNNTIELLVMIKEIRHYETLYDYLNYETPEKVAPHIGNNYNDVVEAYHKFVSDEGIKLAGGFNGIVIELIGSLK